MSPAGKMQITSNYLLVNRILMIIFAKLFGKSRAGDVAEIAQLVERWLPKPKVAGPSPVFRSK